MSVDKNRQNSLTKKIYRPISRLQPNLTELLHNLYSVYTPYRYTAGVFFFLLQTAKKCLNGLFTIYFDCQMFGIHLKN